MCRIPQDGMGGISICADLANDIRFDISLNGVECRFIISNKIAFGPAIHTRNTWDSEKFVRNA